MPSTSAGAEVGEQQDEREVHGDQLLRAEPGVEVAPVDRAEPGDVALLLAERLADAHAGEALLEVGVELGDAVAGLLVGDHGAPAVPDTSPATSGGSTAAAASASGGDRMTSHTSTPTQVRTLTTAVISPVCTSWLSASTSVVIRVITRPASSRS